MTSRPRQIVILGGGHAGVRCAQELARRRRPSDNLEIVLISRENTEVWHGLMPQVLSGVLQPQHVLIPLREFLPGVRLYAYDIDEVDLAAKRRRGSRSSVFIQMIARLDEPLIAS